MSKIRKVSKADLQAAKIQTLELKLKEAYSQQAHVYYFASDSIKTSNCAGGGIVVTLNYIGGGQVCPPFTLKDGLSDQLKTALRTDILSSYLKAVELAPVNPGAV